MKENKFCISINPSPAVSTEDWYLGCIRDLVDELRKFREVELLGQERLDMLKDKQTKEQILAAIDFRDSALKIVGEKFANDCDYSYEDYKKKTEEIDYAYNHWIKAIESGNPIKYYYGEDK